jgi:hypothetical protein
MKNQLQVATVGCGTDSLCDQPRTPSQDAPIFHRQRARRLKTKMASNQPSRYRKYVPACNAVLK